MAHSILGRRSVYTGKAFRVEQVDLSLPNGRLATYDRVVHPGSVTIVPVDDQGLLYFVRQYRVGVEGVLLELPAGTKGKDENPLQCAEREMREEIGMTGELVAVGDLYLAPGYTDEHMTIFLATALEPAKLDGDEDEFIEIVKIPVKKVLEMVAANQINDAKSLAALMFSMKLLQSYL